jgi:hypothetical protein
MATQIAMASRPRITTGGTQGFLLWLQQRQPYLFERIRGKIPAPQLSGLGGTDAVIASAPTGSASNSIVEGLKTLLMGAGQVLLTKEQLKAQQQILEMQLDRARAGLPPADIDPTAYGLPAPGFKVGVDADAKRMLYIGGGVAAGLLLLFLLTRSRRGSRA